jgi:hypothetical protein
MNDAPQHLVESALLARHERLALAASLEPGVIQTRTAEPVVVKHEPVVVKHEPVVVKRECFNDYCACHAEKNGGHAPDEDLGGYAEYDPKQN